MSVCSQTLERGTSLFDAFRIADDILRQAVQGISDLIIVPGLINLDFADVKTVMQGMGMALMGTGTGLGESRAADAAKKAISSRLLEDSSITGARGVLINITGGRPAAPRGQRSVQHHSRRGRQRGQHHLRSCARRKNEGRSEDHGHRDRLRSQSGGDDGSRRGRRWRCSKDVFCAPRPRIWISRRSCAARRASKKLGSGVSFTIYFQIAISGFVQSPLIAI